VSVGRSNCGSGVPVAPAVQVSMRPPRKGMTGPPHVATAMIAPILMTSAPNCDKVGCGKYKKMNQGGRLTGYEFVWEGLKVAEGLIKAQAKVLGVPGQSCSTNLLPEKCQHTSGRPSSYTIEPSNPPVPSSTLCVAISWKA
jgi:hypothetical protein